MSNFRITATCFFFALLCCTGQRPVAEGPRPRVVSLLPNATEILFAIGAGNNIVGATRYCTRPNAAKSIKRVGGILDVSVEAVLALHPDLVIGSPAVLRGRLGDTLERIGVQMLPLEFETAESIVPGVLAIGSAVGRLEDALRLADQIKAEFASLENRARKEPPIKVLVVVGRSPLVVAAKASFIGEILERAGFFNVVESPLPFPTWSFEQVLRSDPDVVIDAAIEAQDLKTVLANAGLRAAREDRVIRLQDEALLRPGPGTISAALALAELVMELMK